MSMIEDAKQAKAEQALAKAIQMRQELADLGDEFIPDEIESELDDAYFTLGDLKHVCMDYMESNHE